MPKPVEFVGSAKEDLSAFPKPAKAAIGHLINEIAHGVPLSELNEVKPFPSVGPGAYEISTRTGAEGLDHRAFIVVKLADAVYVLHAFEKKQQKTPASDIAQGKTRYGQVLELHKREQARAKKLGKK